MELIKIEFEGIYDTYMVDSVEKEFRKAVDEPWKKKPPWKRYQKKLIQDLAALDKLKEKAINLSQFEQLSGEINLFSIRHPESKKNLRILYTLYENSVILLYAFLEKNSNDYSRAIKVANKRIEWLCNDNL